MIKTIAGPLKSKRDADETARALGANASTYSVEKKDSEGYGTGVYDYFVEIDESVPSGKIFGYNEREFMARQYRVRNPIMATKKATPAQIAARKLFAERAKAGAFAPKSKRAKSAKTTKHFSASGGVEAAEAKLRIAKKIAARKKNPIYDANKVAKRGRYVVYWNVTNGNGSKILTLDVSKADAVRIAKHKAQAGYHTYVENGDTGEVVFDSAKTARKSNPLTRVKVKSPSMKTGEAPSKRLVKRRKATAKAAPGYYANPRKKIPVSISERAMALAKEMNKPGFFKKAVGYYPSEYSPDYELVALFNSHAEAVSAATLYAENHPKFRWFVKTL